MLHNDLALMNDVVHRMALKAEGLERLEGALGKCSSDWRRGWQDARSERPYEPWRVLDEHQYRLGWVSARHPSSGGIR